MKSILMAAFVLTCFGTNCIAQCKNVTEQTDAFTNKKSKTARLTIGNLMTKWGVEFEQSDGVTTMKWGIAMVGEYNQELPKGTKLLLKLEDGTVLTLGTKEASAPVTQAVSGVGTVNVFSTYYLKFDMTKETLTSMAKSAITDFKVDVPDQKIKNPKASDKQLDRIKDVCECLLNG